MLALNQLPQASIPPIFTQAPLVSQFLSEPVYANRSLRYSKLDEDFFFFFAVVNFGQHLTQEDTDYSMNSHFLFAQVYMQFRQIVCCYCLSGFLSQKDSHNSFTVERFNASIKL